MEAMGHGYTVYRNTKIFGYEKPEDTIESVHTSFASFEEQVFGVNEDNATAANAVSFFDRQTLVNILTKHEFVKDGWKPKDWTLADVRSGDGGYYELTKDALALYQKLAAQIPTGKFLSSDLLTNKTDDELRIMVNAVADFQHTRWHNLLNKDVGIPFLCFGILIHGNWKYLSDADLEEFFKWHAVFSMATRLEKIRTILATERLIMKHVGCFAQEDAFQSLEKDIAEIDVKIKQEELEAKQEFERETARFWEESRRKQSIIQPSAPPAANCVI